MRGHSGVKRTGYGSISTQWTTITSAADRERYLRQMALGLEDYLRESDVQMRWLGAGAAAHGLEGEAGLGTLEALLVGVDPDVISGKREPKPADPSGLDSVQRLAPDAWSEADIVVSKRRKNQSYEVVLSPPKSVSVAWGLGGEALARAIEAIHEAAVREAFAVLERECAWSRKGKRPAHGWIGGGGLYAQAARHTTSRAGDVQLHSHVNVANMIRCEDGDYRSLDSDFLFTWRPAAAAAYGRCMYAGLEAYGIALTEADAKGVREIAAIPESLVRRFSTRTNVIEEEAEKLALARAAKGDMTAVGPKERAIISDNTRRRKDLTESLAEKRQRWATEAAAQLAGDSAWRHPALRTVSPREQAAASLAAAAMAAARRGRLDAGWAGAEEMIDDGTATAMAVEAVTAVAARGDAEDWDPVKLTVAVGEAAFDAAAGPGDVDADRRLRLLQAAASVGDPMEDLQAEFLTFRRPPPAPERWDVEARRATAQAVARVLTDDIGPYWDRERLLRTLQEVAPLRVLGPDGAARRVTTEALNAFADSMIRSGLVREIATVGAGVDDPERKIRRRPGMQRWATAEQLRREVAVDTWWRQGQSLRGLAIDRDLLREACADEGLDQDQTEILEEICAGDQRTHLVVGPAGAGKSRMMAGLREAARRAQQPLVGLAVSQGAVDVLKDAKDGPAIANSSNIDYVLTMAEALGVALQRDPRATQADTQRLIQDFDEVLPARALWIVDEAGQVSTAQWRGLSLLAERRAATVIAVGDPEQFGSVKPGNLYTSWCRDEGLVRHELGEVRRFEALWERACSKRLRVGNVDAVEEMADHGRFVDEADTIAVVGRIAAAYTAWATEGFDVAVVAGAHHETDTLNAAIRKSLFPTERAEVRQSWRDDLGHHERAFAVGDQVITLRNDRGLATSDRRRVVNGDRWTVTEITGEGGLRLKSLDARQRTAEIPPAWLDRRDKSTGRPLIDHGWATNAYKTQGRTVDRCLTWMTRSLDRRGLYVALTRGRGGNWGLAAGDDGTAAAEARSALGRDYGTEAAIEADRLAREELARRRQAAQQPQRPAVYNLDAEEPPTPAQPRPPPVELGGGFDI